MTVIINQPFGLGDVIFCQTLVHRIANGNQIVWPVMPWFVEGLQRAYPSITFTDWRTMQIDFDRRDQYEFEHPTLGRCTVLPLRWAVENLNLPYNDCMKAKYMCWGMDFEDWREGAMWNINDAFAFEEMGTTPYVLVNRIFGSDCKLQVPIPKQINELTMMPSINVSLFDWTHRIQGAAAIHTVNTSIIYLLEMLDLKAPEVHLYQRSIKGQTFDNIKYLLKRHKYIYHE